jgi:hypothetical protein
MFRNRKLKNLICCLWLESVPLHKPHHYSRSTWKIRRRPTTRMQLNLKEKTMMYKTIVLQLLENRPALHQHLRKNRLLLEALNYLSTTLKAHHQELTAILTQKSPGRNQSQIAREALEIAVAELQARLPPESNQEPLSLDAAMAFVLGSQYG